MEQGDVSPNLPTNHVEINASPDAMGSNLEEFISMPTICWTVWSYGIHVFPR
jgi:hypothetical protein